MSRIDDLRVARAGLLARMKTCPNDQNYTALVRTLQSVNAELDELSPEQPKEATGLDEFTQRLRERQSAAAAARRSS